MERGGTSPSSRFLTKRDFMNEHQRMLKEIQADVHRLAGELGKQSLNPETMAAMADVPRHEFVPADRRELAYINHALPLAQGQTISQPFIVALMTDLLAVGAEDTVLEIGTGSGYQAAVLAELVKRVYSVEFIAELGEQALVKLHSLGYNNVEVCIGDGNKGWPEHAPYDGIIVTAAAKHIPHALIEQLKPGRRLVIPIGAPYETQWLTVVEKDEHGATRERPLLPVAFVPLVK